MYRLLLSVTATIRFNATVRRLSILPHRARIGHVETGGIDLENWHCKNALFDFMTRDVKDLMKSCEF